MASAMLWVLQISLFLSVLTLGLRATPQDATHHFRRPEVLARSLLSMNGIMVLLAVVLVLSFDFLPVVKLALVTLAVSPIPPILPRRALKAGGDKSYTTGLLVAAALASIVLIPLTMEVLQGVFGMPLRMSALRVAALASTSILLPLAVGITLHKFLPSLSERAAGPIATLSVVLLLLSILPVLIVGRGALLELIGNGTILAFVAFSVLGLAVGHTLGAPDGSNRVVLALSTATRHPGIALAIAQTNFPQQRAAPALILFLLVNLLVSGIYVAWYSRRHPPQAATPREAGSKV